MCLFTNIVLIGHHKILSCVTIVSSFWRKSTHSCPSVKGQEKQSKCEVPQAGFSHLLHRQGAQWVVLGHRGILPGCVTAELEGPKDGVAILPGLSPGALTGPLTPLEGT